MSSALAHNIIMASTSEYKSKDTFIQNCTSDVESSNKCRMYREIKTVYKCENYMDYNIRHDLRMSYTKFRLSSHKFMVERARWRKDKYHITKEHAHCVTFMMCRMSFTLL